MLRLRRTKHYSVLWEPRELKVKLVFNLKLLQRRSGLNNIRQVAIARSEYSILFLLFFLRLKKQSKNEIIFDYAISSIRKKKSFYFRLMTLTLFSLFFFVLRNVSRLNILVPCFFLWLILGHKSNKELINNNDSEDYRWLSVFQSVERDSMNFMKTNISWIHNR